MSENRYRITTDSNTEVPLSIAREYDLCFVPMDYLLDGQEYFYDLGAATDYKAFFDAVRGGKIPSTSTYPPQYYVELWRPMLEAGLDVLHLSFSSQLSAAYRNLSEAVEQLNAEYPERRLIAVDTKSISGGAAVLVCGALERQTQGQTMDEVLAWVQQNIPFANHWFTVADLNHLRRGGRLSSTSAVLGTMLGVKPILTLNGEGKVVAYDKVKGRKKALNYLVDRARERAVDPEHNICMLVHGDCLEEALEVQAALLADVPFKKVHLQYVGPVIGAHAGPDTMGLCFLGQQRPD